MTETTHNGSPSPPSLLSLGVMDIIGLQDKVQLSSSRKSIQGH